MAAETSSADDTASFDTAALPAGTAVADPRGPDTRGPDPSVGRVFFSTLAVDDDRAVAGRDPWADDLDGEALEDPDGGPVSAAATEGIAAIAAPIPRPTASAPNRPMAIEHPPSPRPCAARSTPIPLQNNIIRAEREA
ncbi:MAG: hypothetical protein R2763_09085 [Mycobacterium sp.]